MTVAQLTLKEFAKKHIAYEDDIHQYKLDEIFLDEENKNRFVDVYLGEVEYTNEEGSLVTSVFEILVNKDTNVMKFSWS